MAKPINVLYVTSESLPYVRVQSLADISYSYVMAMREQGVDIRLFMPRYGITSERRHQIHYINRLTNLEIPMGKSSVISSIKSSSMNSPRTKVQAYITTNDEYFSNKLLFAMTCSSTLWIFSTNLVFWNLSGKRILRKAATNEVSPSL